jgi:hypothetical protein
MSLHSSSSLFIVFTFLSLLLITNTQRLHRFHR